MGERSTDCFLFVVSSHFRVATEKGFGTTCIGVLIIIIVGGGLLVLQTVSLGMFFCGFYLLIFSWYF